MEGILVCFLFSSCLIILIDISSANEVIGLTKMFLVFGEKVTQNYFILNLKMLTISKFVIHILAFTVLEQAIGFMLKDAPAGMLERNCSSLG